MGDDNIEYLKLSIENENNKCILNLNSKIIKERKEEILNELPISKNEKTLYKKKLKEYRYIDEIQELHIGAHVRWIKFTTDNEVSITNGAILTDVLFQDNIQLLLKNNMNRFFSVNFNDNFIFQKLTDQQKIILFAIDNIDKLKV
tara:strand:- start:5889 stop:6323 length:435 start_codon:yes stop_codon:yes gene_type:complete